MGIIKWVSEAISDLVSENETDNINTVSTVGNDYEDNTSHHEDEWMEESSTNPANGLPMIGCVDIEGNIYGTDSSFMNDSFMNDSFGSSSTDW